MPLSLPRLLAAPTLAGLLFLIPPSIAQPNSDNSPSPWNNFIVNLLKLLQEDISNKQLKDEILDLLEDKSDDNVTIQSQIDDLREQLKNQASSDTKDILDEIEKLSTKLSNIETSALEAEDVKEIFVKVSEEHRTNQDQELEKRFTDLEKDLIDIKVKELSENSLEERLYVNIKNLEEKLGKKIEDAIQELNR